MLIYDKLNELQEMNEIYGCNVISYVVLNLNR